MSTGRRRGGGREEGEGREEGGGREEGDSLYTTIQNSEYTWELLDMKISFSIENGEKKAAKVGLEPTTYCLRGR